MIFLRADIFLTGVAALIVAILIIVVLVLMLLLAKAKLTVHGKVTIRVNDDRELRVEAGSTLLQTLAAHKIYVPSACGGSGTCGLCKCRVIEGGGGILPTETGFFTRKEQQNFWRLACQVKVRNDMRIELPAEILGIRKLECTVLSNRNVATFIKEIVLQLPAGAGFKFRSGGYVQVDVPKLRVDYARDITVDDEYRQDWEQLGLFDLITTNTDNTFRAYSMANHPAESDIVMLNVRIATPPFDGHTRHFMKVNPGVCSSYIFSRKPGDKVTISGPYGEFHLKTSEREMMFIGGGAGMAPMRSHIFHLFKTLRTTRKVSFWYGARSRREIFYEEDFRAIAAEFPNFSFHIALSEPKPDDNWSGYTGFIHKVIYDNYLALHDEPEEIEYYLCGPPLMTDSVIKMLDDLGVDKEMIAYDDFGG